MRASHTHQPLSYLSSKTTSSFLPALASGRGRFPYPKLIPVLYPVGNCFLACL